MASYNYEVVPLADRGFKSIVLFRFIDKIGWKYYIRCISHTGKNRRKRKNKISQRHKEFKERCKKI